MILEFISVFPITSLVFFSLFSLAVGSLLNVIIYRLPLMLLSDWTNECQQLLTLPEKKQSTVNLFFPRSFCPSCKSTIPFWHNIPLVSYCLLSGRCHQCKTPISWRYPSIEALCLFLSLLAVWQIGLGITLLFVLIFIYIIICLFFIDIDHQLLPDNLTLSLLWLGLIANSQELFTTLPDAVFSAAGAYISLWLFIKLFYLLTGKIGMGNGDFKLFAAFGAWFGFAQLPLILLLSSTTGAIVGILYLKRTHQTKNTPIPFGPFLCVAGLVSLFYGKAILSWYLQFY